MKKAILKVQIDSETWGLVMSKTYNLMLLWPIQQ